MMDRSSFGSVRRAYFIEGREYDNASVASPRSSRDAVAAESLLVAAHCGAIRQALPNGRERLVYPPSSSPLDDDVVFAAIAEAVSVWSEPLDGDEMLSAFVADLVVPRLTDLGRLAPHPMREWTGAGLPYPGADRRSPEDDAVERMAWFREIDPACLCTPAAQAFPTAFAGEACGRSLYKYLHWTPR